MAREIGNYVTADTSIVTTAETAAITSDGFTPPTDGAKLIISGVINITTGASVTGAVIRVRRGVGVAGALVGETEPHNIGAAVTDDVSYQVTDSPGAVAGQQYTATVVQTAATGNGIINNASINVTSDQ
jgi:hypothetical protein